MKVKFKPTLDTINIITTLILGIVALIISINSYRLSERQIHLIERQNDLDEGQLKLELKNSILELINISSMLRQNEKDYPDIRNCLNSFNEIKAILEGQLKNKFLFENNELSDKWTSLLIDVNFNIKLFRPGTSPNVKIDRAYNKVQELENKSSELLKLYK